MTRTYKGKYRVSKNTTEPKERIERRIIIDFLEKIPIEDLKKLVNLEEIDFENEDLWIKAKEDINLYELLHKLRWEKIVMYVYDITLDTEEETQTSHIIKG